MAQQKARKPQIRRRVRYIHFPKNQPILNPRMMSDLSCECDTFEEDVSVNNDLYGGIDDMMPKCFQGRRKKKK